MVVTTSEIQYANYSEWKPKDYLAEYYAQVMADERFTLEFLVESLRKTPSLSVALDFGCGPIASHILPLVPKVQEIHMAEYVSSNRAEVEKWLTAQDDAHDWREFTLETLRQEGNAEPTAAQVNEREQQARDRVTRVLPGDVTDADPLGPQMREFYPLVMAHYCAEAVSTSKEKWRVLMQNIMSLVKPGGILILSACGAGNFYRVGDLYFPCSKINGQDMLASLCENNFTNIDLRIRQIPDHSEQGYSNVIFACAVKPSASPA